MYFYWRAGVAAIGIICAVNAQFEVPDPGTAPPDISGCVDVIIAFDTSCSITNSNQAKARNLMKAIVNQLEQSATSNIGDGSNHFRIGVIRFQHYVPLVLSLAQGIDAATINTAIDTVIQNSTEECHTHSWSALKLARNELNNPRTGDPFGVTKVLFIVYDGITYGDRGFYDKPKTMQEIDLIKDDGVEVYVFQQDYLQETTGQVPSIELDVLEHDTDHRFQVSSATVTDVFQVMADQSYTICAADDPFCNPLPTMCTGMSVQSFKDHSKSWDDTARVSTWDKSQTYRFSKINLGLKGGDLISGIIHVSFESESIPNHFIKANPSAKTISLSRRPADDNADQPTFDEEASFIEHANKFRNKHVALESVAKPGLYICEKSGDLVLREIENTDEFEECVSFLYTILR